MTVVWIVFHAFCKGRKSQLCPSEPCPVFVGFSRNSGLRVTKTGLTLPKTFSLSFFPRTFFLFPPPCLEKKSQKRLAEQGKSGQCRAEIRLGRPMETHGILQGSWEKLWHSVGTFGKQTWFLVASPSLALWGWFNWSMLQVGSLVGQMRWDEFFSKSALWMDLHRCSNTSLRHWRNVCD